MWCPYSRNEKSTGFGHFADNRALEILANIYTCLGKWKFWWNCQQSMSDTKLVYQVCGMRCVAPNWEAAFLHILENWGGCFACHLGSAPKTSWLNPERSFWTAIASQSPIKMLWSNLRDRCDHQQHKEVQSWLHSKRFLQMPISCAQWHTRSHFFTHRTTIVPILVHSSRVSCWTNMSSQLFLIRTSSSQNKSLTTSGDVASKVVLLRYCGGRFFYYSVMLNYHVK